MSKDVLENMTKEDKARDYDRIYAALVEATQEMGRQSCEMEKMRRRLRELKPPKRYVSVTVEARALAEDVFKAAAPETDAGLAGALENTDIVKFLTENRYAFFVTWDAKYEEEED